MNRTPAEHIPGGDMAMVGTHECTRAQDRSDHRHGADIAAGVITP